MRDRGRGGDGGRDWGSIDWSNIDLSGFGRGTRVPGPSRRAVLIALVLVVLLVIPLFVGPVVGFLTDLLWFRSLGLEDVYLRRYTAGFWAFVAFVLIFFVVAVPNLYLALRPQVPRVVVAQAPRPSALAQTLRLLWVPAIPAFFFGLAGGDQWDQLLRWLNAVPFGVSDPLFGEDVGFYFFTLPVLEFVRGWGIAAVLVIAAGVVAIYAVRGVISVATSTITRADLGVAGRTALALARPARAPPIRSTRSRSRCSTSPTRRARRRRRASSPTRSRCGSGTTTASFRTSTSCRHCGRTTTSPMSMSTATPSAAARCPSCCRRASSTPRRSCSRPG